MQMIRKNMRFPRRQGFQPCATLFIVRDNSGMIFILLPGRRSFRLMIYILRLPFFSTFTQYERTT